MKTSLLTTPLPFSGLTFLFTAILNALGSVFLAISSFGASMGSFTHNVDSTMSLYRMVGYVWAPPQTYLLSHAHSPPSLDALAMLTLAWSVFVGLVFGFIAPQFLRLGPGPNGPPADPSRYDY